MSSTNKTSNIELSQYIGTDKPTYLNDYNGDMLKIDTAIGTDRADIVTAQNRADAAYSGMETNAGNITTLNGQMSAANTAIADTAGDVTTIQSLIGNGTPTTTDQTIIGAINEINSNLTYTDGTYTYTYVAPAKASGSDGTATFAYQLPKVVPSGKTVTVTSATINASWKYDGTTVSQSNVSGSYDSTSNSIRVGGDGSFGFNVMCFGSVTASFTVS